FQRLHLQAGAWPRALRGPLGAPGDEVAIPGTKHGRSPREGRKRVGRGKPPRGNKGERWSFQAGMRRIFFLPFRRALRTTVAAMPSPRADWVVTRLCWKAGFWKGERNTAFTARVSAKRTTTCSPFFFPARRRVATMPRAVGAGVGVGVGGGGLPRTGPSLTCR